jgi:hypothetical protein
MPPARLSSSESVTGVSSTIEIIAIESSRGFVRRREALARLKAED